MNKICHSCIGFGFELPPDIEDCEIEDVINITCQVCGGTGGYIEGENNDTN